MPTIEKSVALRKVPTSGTTEGVGTLRFVDPITGDAVVQEQFGSTGYPTRFVKIASAISATGGEHPTPGAITAVTNANAALAQFSGAFLFGSPVGLLLWMKQAGANQHRIRKLISVNTTNIYDLNTALPAALVSADSYDLLIDTFRFNALYLKAEFSGSAVSCVVQPIFYAMNQGPENPTPATAKPIRFQERSFSIDNSGLTTDVETGGYYHGNIISVASQGSLGMKVRIASIAGAGSVSLWAAAV